MSGISCVITQYLFLQVVKNQCKTDNSVVTLVIQLKDAISYAELAWSTKTRTQHLEEAIIALLQQSVECCVFIKEYTGHGFFGMY